MSTIPTLQTPRDRLLMAIARLNGQLQYLQAEAARMGIPTLEEDLAQLWVEVIRIEGDFHRMAYPRSRPLRTGQLRAMP